jgi:hypothetical protein
MEIWKDIKGYENLYQVSNYGNVRSIKYIKYLIKDELKWKKYWIEDTKIEYKLLSPAKNGSGYITVSLRKNNKNCTYYVHRLLCSEFIPNPKNKTTVNHKDGNKHNNNLDNLEWATQKENISHYWNTIH